MKKGNMLIADFMGVNITPLGVRKNVIIGTLFEDQLQYDTSWDWLMPVVEKIEGLDRSAFQVLIDYRNTWIKDRRFEPILKKEICGAGGSEKITPTYKAVVQFINWHNSLTPPNH